MDRFLKCGISFWKLDFYLAFLELTELISKPLDLVRGQGARRSESGAYKRVREHFLAARNTAIVQEMRVLESVLAGCLLHRVQILIHLLDAGKHLQSRQGV